MSNTNLPALQPGLLHHSTPLIAAGVSDLVAQQRLAREEAAAYSQLTIRTVVSRTIDATVVVPITVCTITLSSLSRYVHIQLTFVFTLVCFLVVNQQLL